MLSTLPAIRRVIHAIAPHDRNLADHLRRASTAVVLNLAEADGHHAGNRFSRLRSALGELKESRAALQVGVAFEYVTEEAVRGIDSNLDEVTAMTWRRLHTR